MSAQSCTSQSPPFGRFYAEPPLSPRSAERTALQAESPFQEGAELASDAAGYELPQTPDRGFLVRIWLAYRRRRNEARLRNLATDMDPHLLQDVGAPEWLINETTVQRDLARLRNADYMRW